MASQISVRSTGWEHSIVPVRQWGYVPASWSLISSCGSFLYRTHPSGYRTLTS
ncbi:hypothetical protein M404DRAFT_1008085 [Pisolithus tinctorius Marx 270]|uniref:Uncharacterized protein n=1 Tax=Pisolithus tinctorius Marx 270 TaxID=870435 RepID=A0A0C3NH01_PISTI|nr:hypothetical protein M404DRAFT_1008085 [Pisolithus tinctorius Marx 270]